MQPIRKRGYSRGCKKLGCYPSEEAHYVTAARKPWAGLNKHRGYNSKGTLLTVLVKMGCEHFVYVETGRWQAVFVNCMMAWSRWDVTVEQWVGQSKSTMWNGLFVIYLNRYQLIISESVNKEKWTGPVRVICSVSSIGQSCLIGLWLSVHMESERGLTH